MDVRHVPRAPVSKRRVRLRSSDYPPKEHTICYAKLVAIMSMDYDGHACKASNWEQIRTDIHSNLNVHLQDDTLMNVQIKKTRVTYARRKVNVYQTQIIIGYPISIDDNGSMSSITFFMKHVKRNTWMDVASH
jgi:hypothetical protein